MPATHYDYVIVGAGAAGCAVANRLSADPGTSVLLLEAGGRDWSPLVHMPVGFTKLSGPRYNWEFSTVPQPQLNNREMWYPQGRTLGGQHLDQRDDLHPRPAGGLPGLGGARQPGVGLRAGAAVLPPRRGQRAAQRPLPQQRRRGERHRTGAAQPAQQGVRPRRAGARRPLHRRLQRRGARRRQLVRRHPEERPPGEHRHRLPEADPQAQESDRPDPRARPEDPGRERPRRRAGVHPQGRAGRGPGRPRVDLEQRRGQQSPTDAVVGDRTGR